MDEKMMKEKVKEAKKKGKRTIKRESIVIHERLEEIGKKKGLLEAQQTELLDKLIAETDPQKLAGLKEKIEVIKGMIEALNREHKELNDTLEVYSRVSKNGFDKIAGGITAGSGVVSTLGAIGLGVWSARKIYQTDITSGLYNHGIRDFFLKINPFHIKS